MGADHEHCQLSRLQHENAAHQQRISELEHELAMLRAEHERLHAENERLHSVADFTYDWEYWLSPTGAFLYVSPSCERITGYRPDEFVADPGLLERIIHPDDRETACVHLLHEQHKQPIGDIQFRIIRRDGELRWIRHVCQPVYNAAGDYLGQRASNRDSTGRKQAEDTLREQQRFTQQITEMLPDLLYIYDFTARRVVFTNAGLQAVLGYTDADLAGDGEALAAALIHPEDRALVGAWLRHYGEIGDDQQIDHEVRVRHRDGSWRTLVMRECIFSRNPDGTPGQVLGVAQDITERQEMEQALRESEASLRALIDNNDDLIWSIDTQYRLIVANELFHARISAAIGHPFVHGQSVLDAKLPRDARDEWQGYYDRALRGEVFAIEVGTRFHREQRLFDYRFRPIRTAQGEIIGATVSGRDITARQKTETALRANQARLQAIYDNAAVGICQLTLDGRFLAANQRCLHMLGYTEDELMLLTYVDVLHRGDRIQSIALFEGLAWQEQQSYRIERRYLRKDGTVFWGDLSLTAILDERGQVESILGVLVNITGTKDAEAALRQANAQLQQQSIRDIVTGLHNRHYLDETLPRELQRAARARQPLGVIMLDIDHFKQYSDTYGNAAGDSLLRGVGAFLRQQIRGEDIACRYGGEAFVLVLPGALPQDTRQRALEICAGVQTLVIPHGEQTLPPITVSVGVAGYVGQETTAERLIKAADQALYQARRTGRNRVVVAPGVMG